MDGFLVVLGGCYGILGGCYGVTRWLVLFTYCYYRVFIIFLA